LSRNQEALAAARNASSDNDNQSRESLRRRLFQRYRPVADRGLGYRYRVKSPMSWGAAKHEGGHEMARDLFTRYEILIVGAGHGGTQAAITLRQRRFSGSIALIGDEAALPYQRPPLSKAYLAGEKPVDSILIRPAAFWAERAITLMLGQRVIAVEPEAHRAVLSDGNVIGYGTLIWAAGGSPRRLSCPGSGLEGVHVMRTLADADTMKHDLDGASRIVVIGGGYIGLEVAAVLNKLGKSVVVIEAQDRVLSRVAGEPLSQFYEAEHRARGVNLRTGTAVERIEACRGHVSGVRLADGALLPADLVIAGIGIVPEVAPLLEKGAVGRNGIDVDAFCRTSLAGIYAIGDCAAHENRYAHGARIRLESVQNAHDQATVVANALTGQANAYDAIPWFWSNQYDLRLQTAGLSLGYDDIVVRGRPETRSFSIVYRRQGRVIALDCVNATTDYVQGKSLIRSPHSISAEAIADTRVPLKALP
jgi:3-phenylpropionate/trans-cinnamate dioxygenase ferredoxin reductase subunit